MPINYVTKANPAATPPAESVKRKAGKRRSGNVKPIPPAISLDQPGRIRTANFQALLGGLSSPAFYQRMKKGLVPPHDGYDPRPYWKTETVKKFLTEK
jgi:hypothetical protein